MSDRFEFKSIDPKFFKYLTQNGQFQPTRATLIIKNEYFTLPLADDKMKIFENNYY